MRLLRWLIAVMLIVISVSWACAQAQDGEDALTVSDLEIATRPDVFGSETLFADGILTNASEAVAYTDITLFAELYDADDELIGEGIGYPVDECGSGLLNDFALQPGESHPFTVTLELYEDDIAYERVEIIPQMNKTEAADPTAVVKLPGVKQVSTAEVVAGEWIDNSTLRYAVGCDAELFTLHDWYQYGANSGINFPIEHPDAEIITEAMMRQTGLTDADLLNHSYLSVHPEDTRMIYQTDLNTVITSEKDGSFKRIIYDDLSRVSLHGFNWLPNGLFLAYYYGAYGDPVRYFTASMAGQRISADVYSVVQSKTIPGASPDGVRVVIGTTINEKTGYFLTSSMSGDSVFLFESELPGNNYPAPLYVPAAQGNACIYVVRDVEGQTQLDRYDLRSAELTTITPLPLHLTNEYRAWTWLSPDRQRLALGANGAAGGLWLIDLVELDGGCGTSGE